MYWAVGSIAVIALASGVYFYAKPPTFKPINYTQSTQGSVNTTQKAMAQNVQPAPTVNPAPVQPPVITQEEQAKNTVRNFYDFITQRRMQDAYNCFSNGWKSKFTYNGWVAGYDNTIMNRIDQISMIEPVRGNNARVRFQLTARDRAPGGRVLVQTFSGEWRLIYENGRWLMDDADVTKLSSRYE